MVAPEIDQLGVKLDEQVRVSRRHFFVSSALGGHHWRGRKTSPSPVQDVKITAGSRHGTHGRAFFGWLQQWVRVIPLTWETISSSASDNAELIVDEEEWERRLNTMFTARE